MTSCTISEAGAIAINLRRRRQYVRAALEALTNPFFSGPLIPGAADTFRVLEGTALVVSPPPYSIPSENLEIWFRVRRYNTSGALVATTSFTQDPSYTAPASGALGHTLVAEVLAEDRGRSDTGIVRQSVSMDSADLYTIVANASTPTNITRPSMSGGTAGVINHPGTLTYVTSPAALTRWSNATTISHIFQRNGVDIVGSSGSYATVLSDDGVDIGIREWADGDTVNSVFSDLVRVDVVELTDPTMIPNADWGVIEVIDGGGARNVHYGEAWLGGTAIDFQAGWEKYCWSSIIPSPEVGIASTNPASLLEADGSGTQLKSAQRALGQMSYHGIDAYHPATGRHLRLTSPALTVNIDGTMYQYGTIKARLPLSTDPPDPPDPPPGTAPFFTAAPQLQPAAGVQVGAQITAIPAPSFGNPTPVDSHRWFKNGVFQSAITGTSYIPVTGDAGASFTYQTRSSNSVNTTDSTMSNAIMVAASPPPATAPVVTAAPTLSGGTAGTPGTIFTGQQITLNLGQATGNPVPVGTRQWFKDGVVIGGQSAATYTPPSSEIGAAYTGKVLWTNSAGSVLSVATGGYRLTANAPAGQVGTLGQDGVAVAIKAQLFAGTGSTTNYAYAGNALLALAMSAVQEGRAGAPANSGAGADRCFEQLEYFLGNSGRNPPMGGGFTENENIHVTHMLAALRYSSRWNGLSDIWKRRCIATLKAALISGAYVVSPANHSPSKPRTLRGGNTQNLWNASPNFSLPPPCQVLSAMAGLGGVGPATDFLDNLDMNELRQEIRDCGTLGTIHRSLNWRVEGPASGSGWDEDAALAPTDAQIQAAVRNLTFQTTGLRFSTNYSRILRGITCDGDYARRPAFDGTISRGRNNGAGSVGSPDAPDGQPRCGRQPVGTPNPPNMGMTGGAAEIYTANDGMERSSMGYTILGVRCPLGTWINMQLAGMIDRSNADIAFAIPVLDRGMKDLRHKDGTKYYNWSGSGSMRGTWPYDRSWGRHRDGEPVQGAQGGYLFGLYFDCLAPALGM